MFLLVRKHRDRSLLNRYTLLFKFFFNYVSLLHVYADTFENLI